MVAAAILLLIFIVHQGLLLSAQATPQKPVGAGLPLMLALSLVVGSGFCALIYQTVWLRQLRLIFGASTPSSAAVLAIFMGGLGAGGLLLGARAERWRQPLAAYGWMEMSIAAWTALSPLLVLASRSVYLGLGGSTSMGELGATLFRLLLSTLVLGPSVFLMGGTLPAMARAVTRTQDTGRLGLAALYGFNTLGSVLGVILGTFVLFEFLGFQQSLWVACLLNLLVGLSARALSRRYEDHSPASPQAEPSQAEPGQRAAPKGASAFQLSQPWVLVAAFITGFVFLLAELVWYRLASPILGGSTYTFGVVLAVALLGIGLGGGAYSLWGGTKQPGPGRFAVTCALQAFGLLLPFALGDELVLLASHLRGWGSTSFWKLSMGWSVIAGIMILLPAMVAGYQFPLLIALKGRAQERVAQDVGQIYAANTLGSICGSLLGGFWLVPALGAEWAWWLCGVLMLLTGVAALLAQVRQGDRRVLAFAALSLLTLGCAAASGPTASWRHRATGAGRELAVVNTRNEELAFHHHSNRRLLASYEGRESSLGFVESTSLAVLVNGKSDGDIIGEGATTVGLGLLPALVHGQPRSAYVIGLASGVTAGWVAELPGMERVDVSEIEPDMVHFAKLAAPASFNVLEHPKANLLIGDGRELLLTSDHQYDLIISEPSNPYRAGLASFYTVDFYEEALEHLAPKGLFAQWVQGYEIDVDAVLMIAGTMRQTFGHVTVWLLHDQDLLFLASREPQSMDLEHLRQQAAQPIYRDYLGRLLGVQGPEGLASLFLLSDDMAQKLEQASDARNTEDLPLLEFRFARSVGRGRRGGVVADLLQASKEAHTLQAPIQGQGLDKALVERYRARQWGMQPLLEPSPLRDFWAMVEHRSWDTMPSLLPLLQAEDPVMQLWMMVGQLMSASPQEALALANSLEGKHQALGPDGLVLSCLARLRGGDEGQALACLPEVFQAARQDPWLNTRLLGLWLDQLALHPSSKVQTSALELLARGPFSSYLLESSRRQTMRRLLQSLVLADGAPVQACVPILALDEPHPLWEPNYLEMRRRCYQKWGSPLAPQAHEDLLLWHNNHGASLSQRLHPEE